jgi:hypothetical protein
VLGALVGLPVLGLGGRLAMRVLALTTGVPARATVDGTITVLLAGTGAGLVAGVIYGVLAWLLPYRHWPRDAAFLVCLAGLTLRGLHPVRPLPLALFAPVMLLFAVAFLRVWRSEIEGVRDQRLEQPA